MAPDLSAPALLEALARISDELDQAGHRYQLHASALLRSGRRDWEAWFEAGVELRERARTLRGFLPRRGPTPVERVGPHPTAREAASSRQAYRATFTR